MKINWLETNLGVYVETIENGACFLYDQVPYIKTNNKEQQPEIMAVDLEDGTVEFFCPDTIVKPIDAEIRINGN